MEIFKFPVWSETRHLRKGSGDSSASEVASLAVSGGGVLGPPPRGSFVDECNLFGC